MEEYTFDKLRSKIEAAVTSKVQAHSSLYGGEADLEIVDGYIYQTTQKNLAGIHIGGSSVPTVGVIGRSTGRIYYFALSALLPEEFKKIKELAEKPHDES